MIEALPLLAQKSFNGITAEILVDYYERVSSVILPYLRNRPQAFQNLPEGMSEKNFYWKSLNKEIVYSTLGEKETNYVICNDKATLIEMANHGWFEISPWSSTISNPGFPDWIMIDLKPENIHFREVVKVALQIKKVLDEMEVNSYCKTSGMAGLHVYVPLRGSYRYPSALKFAEYVVRKVYASLPFSTTISKPQLKPRKKVYLDFSQNEQGQTLVAPYSLTTGAIVSTPLEWKEVNSNLNPAAFNINTVLKRLEKKGDVWKPLLDEGVNLHNVLYQLVMQR